MYRNREGKIRWVRLVLFLVVFVIISVGLGYLFQNLLGHYQIPKDLNTWVAMLVVFGLLAVINLSILPVPFGVSIVLAAATIWNPVLVALAGSLGSSLGEFSSYFIGSLGKRIAIKEDFPGYKMVNGWINKYGMWAIAFLSFQPIIPFELGGLIAGAAKMPIRKFLPALCIGKFPKYLILIYAGDMVLHLIPHFPLH